MNAGELRHRITLQRATTHANDMGEADTTWAEHTTAWAAIRPASAREIMLAGSARSQVTHTVTIRYVEDIEIRPGSHRVRLESGRAFDIAGVINVDERDVEMRLLCHETEVA